MQPRSAPGNVPSELNKNDNLKARSPADVSILVVDDEPEMREGLCDALSDEGYHVTVAANADDALRLSRASRPDLILMDLSMPVMNGYQFLEQRGASKVLSQIPVIVVSASAAREISRPGVAILPKPVDLEALLVLIRRQLRWQPPS